MFVESVSCSGMKKSPLPVQSVCGTEKKVCGKEALVKLLRWHFGHADFKGRQLEAIEATLSGLNPLPFYHFFCYCTKSCLIEGSCWKISEISCQTAVGGAVSWQILCMEML